jgi:hypothetical protein
MEVKGLNIMAWWLHRLSGCHRLREKDMVLGFRTKVIIVELPALLVVEVTGRGPRRLKLLGFY